MGDTRYRQSVIWELFKNIYYHTKSSIFCYQNCHSDVKQVTYRWPNAKLWYLQHICNIKLSCDVGISEVEILRHSASSPVKGIETNPETYQN